MTITISGTSGVTYPAGGVDNTAGAGVGTTDTQTLTNKTLSSSTLTSPTINGTPVMGASVITAKTAVTASGTSVDFTSIPSWVKRITVMFSGLSSSGTSGFEVRLGTSGGIEATGYAGGGTRFSTTSVAGAASTTGFLINENLAVNEVHGSLTICLVTGNTWTASGCFGGPSAVTFMWFTGGGKTLSGTLTQLRVATSNGTDTFDAGTINIMYE